MSGRKPLRCVSLLLPTFLLAGCFGTGSDIDQWTDLKDLKESSGRVVRVTDGDTVSMNVAIRCFIDGRIKDFVRVRYIGIDAIEISAGIGQPIRVAREGDPELTPFRERASRVKHEISIPVMLVSGIRTLETAKDIVESGDADIISMSRPFIREPELVARWQRGEQVSAKCISCNRCLHIGRRGDSLDCNEERSSKNKAYRS